MAKKKPAKRSAAKKGGGKGKSSAKKKAPAKRRAARKGGAKKAAAKTTKKRAAKKPAAKKAPAKKARAKKAPAKKSTGGGASSSAKRKAIDFIAKVSSDAGLRERYRQNPDQVLDEAGFKGKEKAVLKSGDAKKVRDHYGEDAPPGCLVLITTPGGSSG